MPDVRFERVMKRYGDTPVIREFTLTVRDGEFFTLVGPSGCGKSTVLNLVAGLEPVTAGEIYFGDRIVTRLPPKERDVAMVFQSYALYPHKTVFENLAFPLRVRHRPRAFIESEVRRVAALLSLDGLLAKKPAEISGGERQRVGLGRALIRQPVAFLMDEPLSNLDAHLRVQTRSEIKRLHAHLKTTTLYVTHDQEEALSLSDRIAVLNEGAIQQVGPPMDLYRRPANLFVAQFIGSPRINLLQGRLLARPASYVEVGPARIPLMPAPEAMGTACVESFSGEVVVGVRPEDITVSAGGEDPAFTAVVTEVDPIGARSLVTLRWGTGEIRAMASGETRLAVGQSAAMAFAHGRVHLFDARSGLRLPFREGLTKEGCYEDPISDG